QRKVYEAERDRAAKILQASGKAFDVLPYLTRLRQLCIDPSLYIENYEGGSAKLSLLDSMIPEYIENGHRILVFSQFVKALELLASRLDAKGIRYFMLTGDTPAKRRIEMMNDFNEGDGPDIFLISLKAGGTGLNLTGADTVIHIDPWWNAAAEDQADDRTHRIGQKRNVEVIKLIAEDSIEQRVLELQDMKKDIIDRVISKDDTSVANAKLEDIAFILGK
ncbi:MAG: C-terminal helicase domain-containing protein, partial [Bullifex sp.]|nr:C-terminal helicase domain-containing protein [Bullifex sp.]